MHPVLSFEAWVDAVFDPGNGTINTWPTDQETDDARDAYVRHTIRLWSSAPTILLPKYDFNRIGAGLDILTFEHVQVSREVTRQLRNDAWLALGSLFFELFEPYVSDSLGILSESHPTTAKLNGTCYMWWDVDHPYPGRNGIEQDDLQYFLNLCGRCLRSPKPAIQESAIHGLGHALEGCDWNWPDASELLKRFLDEGLASRPELIAYAMRPIERERIL